MPDIRKGRRAAPQAHLPTPSPTIPSSDTTPARTNTPHGFAYGILAGTYATLHERNANEQASLASGTPDNGISGNTIVGDYWDSNDDDNGLISSAGIVPNGASTVQIACAISDVTIHLFIHAHIT